MVKAAIYHEPNVLHVSFRGGIGLVHMREMERCLPSILRCLRPDFTLLLDLGGVTGIDATCALDIGKMMERIVDAGVCKVISVEPQSSAEIGYAVKAAIHISTALPFLNYANHEEAEKYLGVDRLASIVQAKSENHYMHPLQNMAMVI